MTAIDRARQGARGRGRPLLIVAVAAASLLAVLGSSIAVGAGQSSIAAVRAATAAYHDLAVAEAAGYGPFYICTDHVTDGTMGQHYVKGALVGDAAIDPLQPEALVYEPKRDGGYKLVAIEYVVFADAWDAVNANPPSLFGRTFTLVQAGNRYGLPDFYELHVWLWRPNPSGIFNDWNPSVSCRGMGDPA